MADDDKIPFLILATRQGNAPFTAHFYVRATSLADAYAHVIQNDQGLAQHPDIRLQAFVANTSAMAQVLDLKSLAKFYWNAGREAEANPNHDPTFEETWDEYGAESDEDD